MIMSSPDNKPAGKPQTLTPAAHRKTARPQEPPPKCPRCDSPNTKFCYYNNYNLSQPRHFCKSCRRYWTKGGALRNVPIGGGCRKNKKVNPSLSGDSKDYSSGLPYSSDHHIGGLKFFQGLPPAMDFQLNFPRLNNYNPSNFSTLEANSYSTPVMGFNFPSPIEALSSINQDLHWELQQKRLARVFIGDNYSDQKGNDLIQSPTIIDQPIVQKPDQPILFLDNSKGIERTLATEWYFDNSYTIVNPAGTATSSSNLNEINSSNWNGIQAWSDLNQYTAFH